MHKNKIAGREIWTLLLEIHVKTLRFTHFVAIHFYKNLSYFLLIHSLSIRFSVKETSPSTRDFEYSINLFKMNKNKKCRPGVLDTAFANRRQINIYHFH